MNNNRRLGSLIALMTPMKSPEDSERTPRASSSLGLAFRTEMENECTLGSSIWENGSTLVKPEVFDTSRNRTVRWMAGRRKSVRFLNKLLESPLSPHETS